MPGKNATKMKAGKEYTINRTTLSTVSTVVRSTLSTKASECLSLRKRRRSATNGNGDVVGDRGCFLDQSEWRVNYAFPMLEMCLEIVGVSSTNQSAEFTNFIEGSSEWPIQN